MVDSEENGIQTSEKERLFDRVKRRLPNVKKYAKQNTQVYSRTSSIILAKLGFMPQGMKVPMHQNLEELRSQGVSVIPRRRFSSASPRRKSGRPVGRPRTQKYYQRQRQHPIHSAQTGTVPAHNQHVAPLPYPWNIVNENFKDAGNTQQVFAIWGEQSQIRRELTSDAISELLPYLQQGV